MDILTHRGLNLSNNSHFAESSLDSFVYHLENGFGLEFDLQITKDDKVIVSHDSNLSRISTNSDNRNISDLSLEEICSLDFGEHKFFSFEELIEAINLKQNINVTSAIHLKYNIQDQKHIDIVYSYIEKIDPKKYIIFDITVETARYLKNKDPRIQLAPSVAHPFDIERYNKYVGNTLLPIEVVIENLSLFNWIWFDEWDTKDKIGIKKLYTDEIFKKVRSLALKVAIVSPELHTQSPGLLGSEKHSDAENKEVLFDRIKSILALKPDIICTDYPDKVREIYKNIK